MGDVGGAANVCSVSGDVDLSTRGQGDVSVRSISGNVRVLVPKGSRPFTALKSLVGRASCDCERGEGFALGCKTLSGRIEVRAY